MSLTQYFSKLGSTIEPDARQRSCRKFSIEENSGGSIFGEPEELDEMDTEIQKGAAKRSKKRQKRTETANAAREDNSTNASATNASATNASATNASATKKNAKKKKKKSRAKGRAKPSKESTQAAEDEDAESSCLQTEDCRCSACSRLIAAVQANDGDQQPVVMQLESSSSSSSDSLSLNDVAVLPSRERESRESWTILIASTVTHLHPDQSTIQLLRKS
jgi:hypothetical protein